MVKRKMIGIVLTDLKSFDLVDHQILLSKLGLYGLDDEIFTWLKNTPNKGRRKSQLTTGNRILNRSLVMLFKACIRTICSFTDLPLFTSNVCTDMHADDTTLYHVKCSQNMIEQNLQITHNQLHAMVCF